MKRQRGHIKGFREGRDEVAWIIRARREEDKTKRRYTYFGKDIKHTFGSGHPTRADMPLNWIKMRLEKKGKLRYLDIGPGRGDYLAQLQELMRPYSSKLEIHTLNPTQQPIPVGTRHIGLIETYPERKLGKFDFIISKHASPYYSEFPMQVIQKITRLLKAGGKAYMTIRTYEPNLQEIRKMLGKRFRVETPVREEVLQMPFNLIITRLA